MFRRELAQRCFYQPGSELLGGKNSLCRLKRFKGIYSLERDRDRKESFEVWRAPETNSLEVCLGGGGGANQTPGSLASRLAILSQVSSRLLRSQPALVRPGARGSGARRGQGLLGSWCEMGHAERGSPSLTAASSLPGPLLEPPRLSTGSHQALPSHHPLHAPSSQR